MPQPTQPLFVREQMLQGIRQGIWAAAEQTVAAGQWAALPQGDFLLEEPAESQNGDFASNAAFVWAKELRQSPRKIAEALLSHWPASVLGLQRCEVAGAGFLNFYANDSYFAQVVHQVLQQGARYGHSNMGAGKRVLVEFVSANPTGPMHMGNARGGALGDGLASVLAAVGYKVEREFYVNDAGNQIEKLALSLEFRYRQHFGEALEMPEDAYHGDDVVALARDFAQANGDAFLHAEAQERRKALVDFALPKNLAKMRQNMEKYRIVYDTWFFESTLYASGEVERVLQLLRQNPDSYEQDGALWFRATAHGCDKDFVLVRANGLPTYIVADIAYHYNKLVTRGFDRAVNVLGSDHHGYTLRLRAILTALGINSTRLDVILMQLVRLVRGGEVVRMSKRTGKAVTLEDLLDEIPVDALRFLFNMRDPGAAMDFDLDLALEQSAQNPVYYCQYAHARICSIFAKCHAEGIERQPCQPEGLLGLQSPHERDVIRFLAHLPAELEEAARSYDPARITRYSMELAALFHKFYTNCHILGEPEALLQARLQLCEAVRVVLHNLLTMFKIAAPQSM